MKDRERDFKLLVGKRAENDVTINTSGNIAVCGVTGSGKTSTIMSLIHSLMYQSRGPAWDWSVIAYNVNYKKLGDRCWMPVGPDATVTRMELLFELAEQKYKLDGTQTMLFVDGLDACLRVGDTATVDHLARVADLFKRAYDSGVTWVVSSQSFKDSDWRETGIDDFRGIILTSCIEGSWPGKELRTDQWTAAKKKENGYDQFALSVEQIYNTMGEDGFLAGTVIPGVELFKVSIDDVLEMYDGWAGK